MDNGQVNKLGEKIQKLRKNKGLSQEDLAIKASIPYTTLTKIEIGAIKNPSFNAVAKIANALDIDLNDLNNK